MDKSNDLLQLKNLLLGKEQKQIHDLNQRLSDLDSRTSDLVEVLPKKKRFVFQS